MDHAPHKFFVNDAMHNVATFRVGNQHIQAEAVHHAPFVEFLLHGVARAQQADGLQPVGKDDRGGGVGDMDQRQINSGGHIFRHAMHGIAADDDAARACAFKASRGGDHALCRRLPIARRLQGFDFGKIE